MQVEIRKITRDACCLFAVQVDLGRLTFLTVVGTQGRYVRNSGNEFARAYRLNYSRDGQQWKSWRNRLGITVSWPEVFHEETSVKTGPGGRRRRRATGGEMSQEDGRSAAETCDSVIEQSDGRKNRRKGPAKERKSWVFFV